jgi:CheY-like chemotaxis protein
MHYTMKKIVIAEDSPAGRELLHELIESWGYEVIEAADGSEALQKIMETEPDLVLCDIQMPEQDGYAVIQSLRLNPRFAKLPVIALTAFAMRGDKEKTLAAGFDSHQSKPVEFESLKADIERLLVK